jgi:capsule polysaccharide export protein KpsE/RkpR
MVSVDKKTGVTTLSVQMQDALISAALTDTVMHRLQDYITDYRTNKARHDLAFAEKLYKEAKENYYTAQQRYARHVDGNLNVILQSYRSEQERLQNEMTLAYGVYNQLAQQLQMAKAKVQEITPVYTVVQPAVVPLRPIKPNKIMILFGFVFLAVAGSSLWILYGRDLLKKLKR